MDSRTVRDLEANFNVGSMTPDSQVEVLQTQARAHAPRIQRVRLTSQKLILCIRPRTHSQQFKGRRTLAMQDHLLRTPVFHPQLTC